ncbi:hypothetical protein [Taklimakanibacter albus]|uniref:Uncharacterized protein n=1 Tax=Taklimakanibacter albus TaxID=2800327 RepID=A0ACC5QZE4_9HYPH|nr:hypothetical protein [Aestuariivirga sp. YIM B02566]MBK1865767.1 hypothetical protein [Aestuariivirga sp. YIM B02566]
MNYKPLILAATIAASLGLATAGTAEAHDHGGGRFFIAGHHHGGWGGHHWHDHGWGGFGITPSYGFYGPDYYGYYDDPYDAPYAYWRFAHHRHDHWRFHHRAYY